MVEKTFTRRRWELNGIPCAHACAVIFGNNEEPEDYVHDCYSMRTYLRVYSHVIHPINGHDMWPKASKDIITLNEAIKRKRGGKQMARKKIVEELEMVGAKGRLSKKGMVKMRCQICGQIGHNKRLHKGHHVSQSHEEALPASTQISSNACIRKTSTRGQSSRQEQIPTAYRTKKSYTKSSKTGTTDTNAKAAPISSPTTVQWMMDGSSQRPTRVLNNVEDTMADANVFRSLQTSSSQQTTTDATKIGPIKGNSKKQQSTMVGKEEGKLPADKGNKGNAHSKKKPWK
ncbi:hypothetical protein GH714_010043 [Hevea brasiliensis]|uniref:Zinc finger PMZ-type domain-containing protein n=1 Tax=Hevea brasiliensis TaxID=3981 RepID=A0A6A6LIR3_HEVBR|nr:hypothetical protein GH714_010043 [Hevea brasiliensis]